MPSLHPYQQTRSDRRLAMRRAVSLPARFQPRGHFGWISCEVVNISPMGALLKLASPMIAPSEVRLQISEDFFKAIGGVRHLDGETIGIEFTSSRIEALARYS